MSFIEVKNLKYKYPDSEQLALDDLSFTINKGEFIGIIGQNKAGKSTLCYALAGLVPHFFRGGYGGKVIIDQLEIRQSEFSEIVKKVGLVLENPFSQITGSKFTVYEELAFGLENLGIPREKMKKRIDECLELLEITKIKDKNPFDLSGGQMQRVAIASVIAMKPEVLILDEPTSQLDPQGTSEVFSVVELLKKEGMTIIMAEQKMEKIAQYADRVLLLDNGKLIDFNTPAHIFSREDLLDYGVEPPIITRIARSLGLKNKKTGYYPITVDEISQVNVVSKNAETSNK